MPAAVESSARRPLAAWVRRFRQDPPLPRAERLPYGLQPDKGGAPTGSSLHRELERSADALLEEAQRAIACLDSTSGTARLSGTSETAAARLVGPVPTNKSAPASTLHAQWQSVASGPHSSTVADLMGLENWQGAAAWLPKPSGTLLETLGPHAEARGRPVRGDADDDGEDLLERWRRRKRAQEVCACSPQQTTCLPSMCLSIPSLAWLPLATRHSKHHACSSSLRFRCCFTSRCMLQAWHLHSPRSQTLYILGLKVALRPSCAVKAHLRGVWCKTHASCYKRVPMQVLGLDASVNVLADSLDRPVSHSQLHRSCRSALLDMASADATAEYLSCGCCAPRCCRQGGSAAVCTASGSSSLCMPDRSVSPDLTSGSGVQLEGSGHSRYCFGDTTTPQIRDVAGLLRLAGSIQLHRDQPNTRDSSADCLVSAPNGRSSSSSSNYTNEPTPQQPTLMWLTEQRTLTSTGSQLSVQPVGPWQEPLDPAADPAVYSRLLGHAADTTEDAEAHAYEGPAVAPGAVSAAIRPAAAAEVPGRERAPAAGAAAGKREACIQPSYAVVSTDAELEGRSEDAAQVGSRDRWPVALTVAPLRLNSESCCLFQ